MEKKYVITRMEGKIFSFLLHDRRAVEIHCDEEQAGSGLGNIYIGKIKNIAKNIGAAFVEIAPGSVCYLPLEDMKKPIYTKKGESKKPQAGDELLVQVSREGMKTKAPAVTTNLTLHGKFLLLTTGSLQTSVSSKLPKEERGRLLELLGRVLAEGQAGDSCQAGHVRSEPEEQYGWLLRTNAGGIDETALRREVSRLRDWYHSLMSRANYRTCFTCLYRTPPSWISRLRDLYDSSADEILTDEEEIHRQIHDYLTAAQPQDAAKLRLYQDRLLPMGKLYSLEHQLTQALQERVWLNSGGYLVIQPTEALTVIDVNTGKCDTGKNREATFLKINREAAVEIARQIRLRNMSGIILVDFINMKEKESNDALLSLLSGELSRDPVRTALVDMTKLFLVEITRMKKERPLMESVKR